MALHITNKNADRLLRELAAKTGQGLTPSLVEALEFRLASLATEPDDKESRMRKAHAAVARFRAPFKDEDDKADNAWGFVNRW